MNVPTSVALGADTRRFPGTALRQLPSWVLLRTPTWCPAHLVGTPRTELNERTNFFIGEALPATVSVDPGRRRRCDLVRIGLTSLGAVG